MVRKIELGLREKFFDLLKNGKKTSDGRLFKWKDGKMYKNKYQDLNIGDILVYYKDLADGTRSDEKITVKVNDVKYFDDLEDMLKEMKLKNILPGVKSYKEGEKLYEEIYGNKLKDGVLVGFNFEIVKNVNKENVPKKEIVPKKEEVSKKEEDSKKENVPKNKKQEIIEFTEVTKKPQTYEMYIKEPWMTLIKRGLKEVEGRLFKGPVVSYMVGDRINFIHKSREGVMEEYPVEIIKLTKYPDFKSLLYNENLFRVLPGFPNIRAGNDLYEKYYPFKAIKENGVLAITFSKIGENKKVNKFVEKVELKGKEGKEEKKVELKGKEGKEGKKVELKGKKGKS